MITKNTERYGFSTGALERGNYRLALDWIRHHDVKSVELSAIRLEELVPLVDDLDSLDLDEFGYVSFHAPSAFPREEEEKVVSVLEKVHRLGWNIVVHPDVIYTPSLWERFGSQLLIENMDRRKRIGRTVQELIAVFDALPEARMCLDVAHARQMDTTLTLLYSLIETFGTRIAEVHISELDSHCQHRPLSAGAVVDFQKVAESLRAIPVIIESMLDHQHIDLRVEEIQLAKEALESYAEAGHGNDATSHHTHNDRSDR